MPFFPSPVETHANLLGRMRARAFRPASNAIAFVAPWEAQERVKPTVAHLEALSTDAKAHLSSEVEEEKELASNIEEFRKDHFEPLLKKIQDGDFDCNGPAVFFDIDLAATIVEKLTEEYDRIGKPRTPIIIAKIPEYKPLPTFKETLKKVDWKKWAIGGIAAYGGYWFLSRRTSEAIMPLKDEKKAQEIEEKKMQVGPIVKSETWKVTDEEKTLLTRLVERVTGF